MSKSLLRAVLIAAALTAVLPVAAFAASADLNIYSITGTPDPMTLGTGNVTYSVTINNGGSSTGTNVVLTNTLPASSTFVSANVTSGTGSCSQSSGTVTCTWASMPSGSYYSASIVVTPTVSGAATLSSSVTATEPDPNSVNNSASKGVIVNSQIDLSVTTYAMTGTPDPITLGTGNVQFLTYIANNSTSPGTNPTLTFTLPVNSTFVSATTPVGSGTCTQSGGTATCSWSALAANSYYYAYVTVTPTAGGSMILTATASGTESDSNTTNNSASKGVTVNSQIDLSVSSMTGTPDPITLGNGNVQFLTYINNNSTSPSTNPTLTFTLPVNSTFVSATTPVGSGTCTQSAGTATCTWSSLVGNSYYYAYVTVTPTAGGSLTLAATASGTQSDSNTANNSASKAVYVNSQIDLGISSMTGSPDPITLGTGNVQFLTYINNYSSSPSTNPTITFTLPVNSTFVSATTPVGSGTCTQSAGTATCSWPSLVGNSYFYAYVTVTPTTGGAMTLSATASGTQSDSNSANNSASKAVFVNAQIDLGISGMSGSPDPITLGTGNVQFLTYINNYSSSPSTNPTITFTLPVNSTFVSATTPVGSGTCTQSAGTATCTWSSLVANSYYYAYVTVTPTAGGQLTLAASASGSQTDPNSANNSASKAVVVNSQIDLSVSSISGSPDPITLGSGNVTYTIGVYNGSSSQSTNTALTITLPTNSTFVSASTPYGSGTCTQSGTTATCTWGSLGAGQVYYSYVIVTPTANGAMTLTGNLSGAQSDPNTSNNSASKAVFVGTGGTAGDLQVYSVSGTPDPITLGTGNVTYTVQVYNASSSTGTNTVLTATLPSNSTFVSATATNSGSCTQSGGTVTCNWASILAGNSYYATIVVTPTSGGALTLAASVTGTESDPNTANNSGSKSVTVNSQIDLQVYSVSGTPDPITLGTGNVTYTVQIYNASSSQGTSTVLTNTLPSNSSFVSATATNSGSCTQSGGTVTCNWTSIPAGNSYYATIVVTPTSGGALALTASVTGTESDSNTANNSGSKSVTVNSQIDLQVYNVSGTPDPITLSTGNVTYTVQIYNASSSQGTSIVLTNTLPSNSTFVSATATNSGSCTQSGGTVTCNWASIPAGTSYYATIVVTPTSGGALTLAASVTGTESDPNTANNSGSKSVTVNAQIDLQLYSINATPDPITLNAGNVTYTVSVYNPSTSQGTNTVLTNTLPASSTFVSATATNSGTCSQSSGTVTCNWGSIPTSGFYSATIIVTPTAGGPLTLSSSVSGTESDPNTANNSASKSTTVNSQIDLRVYSISATPDPITLNTGNVTYTVSVYNSSTSQGTNTVLTNTLPASSTFVSASATNSGTCTHTGSTVTCNWTSIPASGFYSATIVVTPTAGGALTLSASVSGTESDPNTADNTGSKSVTVNSQIDLQLYSINATPDPVTLNTGNVTYTVSVYNSSTSQGTNVVLTNTLPASSTFVSATASSSGSCTQSSGTVTCNWTSIPASGFYSATITVTPTAGGPLTLVSSVSGTESDPNTANNTANKSATVNSQIDLSINSMSATPNPITFGAGNVQFTTYVYNSSSSQGTSVALSMTLPSNSTFVSATTPVGSGTCTQSSGVVTCNWASLPAGNNYYAYVTVTPTIPGTMTLAASVSGAQPDPNTANNSSSYSSTVTPTSCTAVPSGAVSWYRAESNGVDSAGPNFATANGGVSYTTGKAGQAFSFDGINESVNAPMTTSLQLTSGLTVEFWMKGDPSNGLNSCCQGLVATDMYAVEIASSGIHFGLSTDGGATQPFPSSGQVAISTNQWHHVAGTYDGATIALYIDGALAASVPHTGTISPNSGFLSIGSEDGRTGSCPTCVGTRYYKGLIDEVAIYSRALSQSEVQAIYGAGTFGKCYVAPSAPSITSFAPGSGGTGTSVVITGSNFIGVNAVKFNGTSAAFAGNSTTQITATVPVGASSGTIAVTAGGGTATSGSTFTVNAGNHWVNASGGNWSVGTNWSTGSVPTSSDNTFIDASGTYTVNLDVAPAFNSLTIGGGATGTQTLSDTTSRDITFTNAGTITTSGALNLSSGRILGGGGLTVNGALNWNGDSEIDNVVTISSGASLNISGTGTRFVNGGTINNSGTINWGGANNISVYSSGLISNLAAGLFVVTNDQQIFQHCCTAGQAFNNAGTFRKTTATGTTSILSNGFNNSGTVDVQSGTFALSAGGSSSGIFNATATGTFLFNNSVYNLTTGATLTGAGNFQVSAGQLNVSASGVAVDHLTMTGGNLNINATGAVSTSAAGVIDWIGDATLSGAGALTISSGGALNISGSGTRYVDGGTINNNGTINWSGANNISVYDSGVINNLGTGLFSVKNDQQIYQHCCAGGQAFNNVGTFRKSVTTGTTTIQSNGFNNSGTVDIQTGTFNPSSGGTSSSVFQTSAAGTFLFSSNTYTLAAGATLTGSGNFQLSGGQLTVNATGVAVEHMTINGGTLNVGGGIATSATGVIDWSADATLKGAGALTIGSGGVLNITGTGTRFIDGGTLNNSGTVNWSGANNISVHSSGVINNQIGGLFSVKNDQQIYQHCCSAGQAFNNAGTFRKSVATGTTTIQSNGFTNTGTVDIQSGTFNPSSGGSSSSIFNTASGATFLFTNSTYTLVSGATLTGSGNYQVSSGTLAVNATGVTVDHMTLNGGTLNITGSLSTTASGVVDWTADATLTGAGSLNIVSGSTMNINGSGTRFIDGGTLNNSGTVNWSGANNISVYSSGVINNQSGGLFSVKNDQQIYQHCCSAGLPFNNAGTFRKSVATGTTTILSNGFTNTGTVDIQTGTFNPSAGGTSSANFNTATGATFLFSNNTYTLASGATLTGAGNYQLNSGTLAVNATGVTVDHLTMNGGILNVAGSIGTSATGVVDWSADATLTGAGALTIGSGGTLNVSGTGTRFIDGGTLNNSGTANWSGANNLSIFNSGVINNLAGALFNVTNNQLVFSHCCSAGQPFNNAGTFRKSASTGTTTFNGIGFSNSGTIQPRGGTLQINSYSATGSPTYDFGIDNDTTYGRIVFGNAFAVSGSLIAAPINGYVPSGGRQFQIFTSPSVSGTFSSKTLTFGSSPVRSFADSYTATTVLLTTSGPTITTPLSPQTGSISGGDSVTITGTGFVSGGSLGVTFGGAAATSVTVVNATTITCTTPAHAPGVVDVVLTNGDGQPTTAFSAFTYDNPPNVTTMRPTSGSTAGSGGVIIEGTNLNTVTNVSFGGINATILSSSAAQLTVAAPPHSAGAVNVVLTNNVGNTTLTNGFTYVANDDAARDFFLSTNPSARWSYGYETSRGSAFNAYGTRGNNAGFDYWGSGLPNLGRNSTTSTLQQATNFTPSMKLEMHPGSSGENSVIRWTAPSAASYRIHGYFVGLDSSYPTTTDVAILHNNSSAVPLFSTNINSYNVPQNFDVTLSLGVGDTIEFTVGFGSNGNFSGDGTGLDVTIDPAGTATADLNIASSASASTVASGAAFSYSTTVTNYGVGPATNVVATIALPANVTLNGSPTSTQGSCTGTTTITCTIGNLAVNGTATQTINVLAGATGTATANASVTATETDPSNTNNASAISVTITGGSTLTVTTNADSGSGSLRQAVLDANNGSICPSPCTIAFNLPSGQRTIAPLTSIPNVDAANVTIDATTQPGFAGTPLVTLDGTSDTFLSRGLQLNGGNDTVKGLSIVNFQGSGILIHTAGNDTISGNYIGIHVDGVTQGQNAGDGVTVLTANNTIGGFSASARNVISGNFGSGVVLTGASATGNFVSGNYIGLSAAGNAVVANQTDGVQILFGASNNTIGGALAATRNVISGNSNSGVYIAGDSNGPLVCNSNVVSANFIGTDATGTAALPNTTGLYIGGDVTNSTIGGQSTSTANTIASITKGISLDGPGNGNVILRNTISGNSGMSIDLANDGPTANDAGDADAGANGLQNTPVFVDATLAGSTLTTHVNVDSSAVGATNGVRVELFKSDSAGTHALLWLGSQCYAGNTLSAAAITIPAAPVAIGDKLVATATTYIDGSCSTPGDGTSELSATPATVAACTPPAATITPGGPTTFCSGGSVNLTASAGASYQWRNFGTPIVGANAQVFNATTSGSYSVTVTSASGCSATSSNVSVTANTTVNVTISAGGPTTFCSGGNVTLTANPSGGSGTFSSYQWLLNGSPIGGANNATYAASASGSYTVTATDSAGCTGTSAIQSVSVNPPPSAAISAPASVCPNSTAGASITSPVGGATYTWSITNGTLQTGQGTSSITFSVTNASPVSISVTASASGCTSNGSASVNVGVFTPTITPNGSQSFCPGGSVTLTSSAANSYQWLLNGSPIASANGQTYAATTAGSYSVSASNASGCSGTSATVTVTQSAAPSPVVTAGGPTTFCQGGSVTLSTGAASSYQWLLNGSPIGGANGQSTPATVSGSYSVTVTNGSGCSATSSPITVTVNPSPLVTITGPSSICGASSVTLDAGAGFTSYNWSTGASTQTITVSPTATTTYNVTVTSAAGCSGSASKTVTVSSGSSSTTVVAPSSVIANSTGNSASVSAAQNGSTYSWSITGGTITNGDGTPSILWTAGPSGSATISVVVTSGSCTASGSATVAITNAADVSLTASAAPNPVNPGGTVTFSLNVANSGPNAALNVRVTNNLYGVTAPAATGNGWSCTTSALTIVCTAASIGAGSSAPLTITATASGNSNAGDDAYVVADTTDPNGGNNTANAQTAIQSQPTCANNAPALLSPAAGASNVLNPVTFTWSASASALSYDLWIASSGAAPAIAATTTSTSAMLSLPSGPSTWYVAAHFGNNCPTLFSTPRDFTVAAATNCLHDAPQLIAPSPNAVINSPVTFNWTPAAQAVGYRLWVAIDGGAAQDVGTTNGATTLTVPLSGSSVTWHVDAIFPGCSPTSSALSTFSLAVADVCGNHSAPSLLAPASGATLTSSIVDLQWSAVSNANGYRVWAGINGAELAPIGTTAAATTLHTTFSSGTVAWFVEALFNGCASSPSPQRTFTITPAASCDNAAPSLLAPANDATIGNSEVDFSWSSVPNAIGYELWLGLNNGTPSPAGTTTATTLRRTVGAGVVDWFVRAQFNGCAPSDSAHAHFTFAPPADCALVRPILTAPADGAAKVFSPLDLRWSNVPGATQYKVWLASGDAAPVVIGTTSATHLDNQTVPSGSVSWFVEALFDHCPALQSTHSTFTSVPPPPPCGTPEIPLPRADSTASTNVEYMIRWTAGGPDATTQYELQESTDPAFTAPVSLTIDASEWPFKHINSGDAPVKYYYRVRSVGTCNGARSLFSQALIVSVLPSNVSDPNSANGSTPADNPQTTHYEIHLGGTSNGVVHKGSIAAAAGDTFTVTTNQPWLTVSPSSGTVGASGTTLNVTATTGGLPVGTSSGAVNITFGSASGNANGNRVALDTRPASTTTISVNLVQPVSPNAKSGPPPDALIIPAVAHADGVNSKFQSDIRVTNSSAQPMKYQVTFVPTGDTGITQGKQTTVDIDPGRTIALDDVLQSWFGDSSATGTLEVRPLTTTQTSSTTALPAGLANILTFASSRTYNTTANGTFGQYIPAIPFAAFVGRGSDPTKSTILSLQQIAQSSAYRTNLGIVEGSGDPASVLVSVYGSNGQKLTEFTQDLKGGQHIQLNSILAQKNVQVTDGRIEVKVVSPVGKVTAYASVLDNQTNDPLLVSPVAVNQTAAARYVIPGVADLNNGIANWQTDVRLFNPSTNIVKATLTFYSQNGGTPQTKDVQLAPGQVQTLDATLRNTFGITNDGGALHIATTATTPLVATARTYNQTPNGTYGQFIPAVTANDAAALGTRPLQILQIEETDRYRTNVGFAEVTGKDATIEVTAVPSDSKVAASTQISLKPNQFIQYPQLLRSMGLSNMYNARISVKVISGQGRVTAYASVIDMQTNDPTFVPAQ